MKLIVPVLNRYDLLNRMIESIDYPLERLLIIDNGYERRTDDLGPVCENPNVQQMDVLNMAHNLGIAPSWNLGVKNYPFEDVFYFGSNDCKFSRGVLEKLERESAPDKVVICERWPHWQLFSVGHEVFEKCGLFDESIFPMNFEDDEFEWRVTSLGFQIHKVELPMIHEGHMTFRSDEHYAKRNQVTYEANRQYFEKKKAENRLNAGEWSLKIRKDNDW